MTMKEEYAEELYEALKNLLEAIPIIAGDSRHDELTLRIHEADKLIQDIEKNGDEEGVSSVEADITNDIDEHWRPYSLYPSSPYFFSRSDAFTPSNIIGRWLPYSRYVLANSPAAWRRDCHEESDNKDDHA